MNPFISEHDAQSEDPPSARPLPMQSIRRKPVSKDDETGERSQVEVEDPSPITDNPDSYGYKGSQTYEFHSRPSLKKAVSGDSFQAQARTESTEDVRLSLIGSYLETPQAPDAGSKSQAEPQQTPTRDSNDRECPISVPKKRQHGFQDHFKSWGPEFGWILLAIALFIALCVILSKYDDSALPNWPMGLTLNTLVALLATVCRSVLIIPIGEGISQLKWNWFVAKKRPIKDLYIFDQASRGPWGSIRLIFRMKGRLMPLSHLASLILVAGLVTSFLTQSTISYSSRLVDGNVPSVAIAKKALSYPINADVEGRQDESNDLMSNAFQAAFLNVKDTWPDSEPRCSGANCTWSAFSSLGVCATLSNITELLEMDEILNEYREDTLNVSLPLKNGTAYLLEVVDESNDNTQPIVNMTSPEPLDYTSRLNASGMTPEEFSKVFDEAYRWPPERESLGVWSNADVLSSTFSQFFFIYANDNVDPSTGDRYRAAELLWHFCVHDYEVEVTDGQPRTKTLDARTKIKSVEKSSQNQDVNTFWLSNSADDETFPVREKTSYSRLDLDFRRAFMGAHSTRWATSADYTEFNRQFGLNLYDGADRNMSVADVDARMWDNLGRLTSNIARSVTTLMRNEEVAGEVIGRTPVLETFIIIRWEWLSFLGAQLGLTLIFLFAIILHTASLDIDIVKSSNISELFARGSIYEPNKSSGDDKSDDASELVGIKNDINKMVQGQLLREGEKWRLHVAKEPPPDVKHE